MNQDWKPFGHILDELGVYGSEGSDWISQRGLLHAAMEVKGDIRPEGVE